MPIGHFHLVNGEYTSEQRRRLLTEACRVYAEALDSPIDRVRVFIVGYDAEDVAAGGAVVADGGTSAPYFTAIVMGGRPAEQRRQVGARFTDLIVDILGVDRSLVRGRIIQADPDDWFIASVPAAAARASEIAARAAQSANPPTG